MALTTIAIFIVLLITICYGLLEIRRLKKENVRLGLALKKAKNDIEIKNNFIRNLTDDLREPLNPITGFSDLLETDNLQPEERKYMSQHIKSSSAVLRVLFDDLAELSYYENLESIARTDMISPNMLCQHMVDSLQSQSKPGVDLVFKTTIGDNFEFLTNYESAERVLRHLIVNALMYTEKGRVTVECSLQENNVRFSVTDTGRGIPEDMKEKMFELKNNRGAETKITGMELSICQTITRLLGGRIWLDKDSQKGTRFVCDLPLTTGVH